MSGGVGVKYVALGGFHTCAILTNGELKCFGENHAGQLGDSSRVNSATPRKIIVDEKNNVERIALGGFHSCAILTSSILKCWGKNSSGQLGNGSTRNSLTPLEIKLEEEQVPIISSITSGGDVIQFKFCQVFVAVFFIIPYLYTI